MIDFHTHVLPGVDDGSRNSDMSMAMLKEEADQGVSLVVATPHFYADQMSVDGFLKRRDGALERVRRRMGASLEDQGAGARETGRLPEMITGAEVYYFAGIGRAGSLGQLLIRDTNTLLLEMPFVQWDDQVLEDVKLLVDRQGYRVVLAHIERYVEFQKDKRIWEKILDLPVIPQINAGSFIEKKRLFRKDRIYAFCIDFARNVPELILGSDCHNMESRRPNLKEGRKALADALGESILDLVDETTLSVLGKGAAPER